MKQLTRVIIFTSLLMAAGACTSHESGSIYDSEINSQPRRHVNPDSPSRTGNPQRLDPSTSHFSEQGNDGNINN